MRQCRTRRCPCRTLAEAAVAPHRFLDRNGRCLVRRRAVVAGSSAGCSRSMVAGYIVLAHDLQEYCPLPSRYRGMVYIPAFFSFVRLRIWNSCQLLNCPKCDRASSDTS